MRFTDAAPITGARRTSDGYLVAQAFAARCGVQLYSGAEVGMADKAVVRVYRPEDEVTAPASVQGYSHTPITLGHPPEAVTSDNWAALAKGEVSTEAEWKDGKLRLPLIVKDAAAIEAIEAGTRELSAGYICTLDFTDGVTPEGEPYDAVQRGIKINHLAIVPRGRAGAECRIGDGADTWGASPITDARKEVTMTTRKIMVDGLEVETTDAGATAIKKLEGKIADATKALTDAEAAHQTAIAAKDTEIGELKAKLADAEAKILTPEALRKAVGDRAALEAAAAKVAKDVDTTLSDADLRRAAVVARYGDAVVADASEAAIEGMFKAATLDAANGKPDAFADAAKTGPNPTHDADGWGSFLAKKEG